MAIDLGPEFEAEVAELAGVTQYDSGSLAIAFLNPNGDTTIRLTVAINVDTDALKARITKYAT